MNLDACQIWKTMMGGLKRVGGAPRYCTRGGNKGVYGAEALALYG